MNVEGSGRGLSNICWMDRETQIQISV